MNAPKLTAFGGRVELTVYDDQHEIIDRKLVDVAAVEAKIPVPVREWLMSLVGVSNGI